MNGEPLLVMVKNEYIAGNKLDPTRKLFSYYRTLVQTNVSV